MDYKFCCFKEFKMIAHIGFYFLRSFVAFFITSIFSLIDGDGGESLLILGNIL